MTKQSEKKKKLNILKYTLDFLFPFLFSWLALLSPLIVKTQ